MKRRKQNRIDDEIDRSLKRAFDAVAQEPVPDRLLDLVERLRTQDAEQRGKDLASDPTKPET